MTPTLLQTIRKNFKISRQNNEYIESKHSHNRIKPRPPRIQVQFRLFQVPLTLSGKGVKLGSQV